MNDKEKKDKKYNQRQRLASLGASVMLIELFLCCLLIAEGSRSDAVINVSIHIFGMALGWVIGTFISPYSEDEENDFSTYAQAASVFVSGYVVGNIDNIKIILSTSGVLNQPYGAFRVILWLASIFIVAMFVFCVRRYEDKNNTIQDDGNTKNPNHPST